MATITAEQATRRAEIYIEHARQLRARGLSGEHSLAMAIRMLNYASWR